MPTYEIKLPNGETYNVDSPTELTNEQAYAAVQSHLAGAPQAPTGRGGVLASGAESFLTGITDIPGGIAGLFYEKPEETPAGRFSEQARSGIQSALGINPQAEPTMAETGAMALGSVASFLVPFAGQEAAAARLLGGVGEAATAARAIGRGVSATQAIGLGAQQQIQDIKQQEAAGKQISGEDKLAATRWGGAIGLADLLPLERFVGPLEAVLAKVPLAKAGGVSKIVENGIKKALVSGTEEGAQEAISQLAQNIVEQGYYNPDLSLSDGLLSNAGAGGFAGGTMDVLLQLATGRKSARARTAYNQLAQKTYTEAKQGSEEAIRADAINGLNTLRTAAPIGNLAVRREQMLLDNGDTQTAFHVVGEDNNPIATFSTPDAAVLAAQQYEKDATGLAKFNAPTAGDMASNAALEDTTPEEKSAGKEIAKEMKAAGALEPAPATTATTPAGQAATEDTIAKAADDTGAAPIDIARPAAPAKPKKSRIPAALEAAPPTAEQPLAAPPEASQAPVIPALKPKTPTAAAAPSFEEVRAALPKDSEGNPDLATLNKVVADVKGQPTPWAQLTDAEKSSVLSQVAPATKKLVTPQGEEDIIGEIKAAPIAQEAKSIFEPRVQALFRPSETTPEGIAAAKAFDERQATIVSEVNKALAPLGLKDVRVKFENFLKEKTGAGQEVFPQGFVNEAGNVISLATNIYDPSLSPEQTAQKVVEIMNHEVIHSLVNLGLFKPGEVKTLFDAVQRTNYPGSKFTYFDRAMNTYGKVYTKEDGTPNMEMIVEEGVAEMFRDWNAGRLKLAGKPEGLFQRMLEFIKRVFRGFKSAKVDDVFRAIKAGEMGAREGKPAEAGGTKFAIPAQLTGDSEQEFGRWFARSKIVDKNGRPMVVYHGTKRAFDEFKAAYGDGLIFFTINPEFASKWPQGTGGLREPSEATARDIAEARAFEEQLSKTGEAGDIFSSIDYGKPEWEAQYDRARDIVKSGFRSKYSPYSSAAEYGSKADIRIIPAFLSVQNPFDPRTDFKVVESYLNAIPRYTGIVEAGLHKSGNWVVYEDKGVIDLLKSKGYDGIWLAENVGGPHETIAVFSPTQVKSIFNEFAPGTAESKKFAITPDEFRKSAWGNIFAGPEVEGAIKSAQDPSSRTTIVAMTPDEYIKAATHGLRNPGQEKVYAENIGRGMSLAQLPYLRVGTGPDGALEVSAHEGRHRVKALQGLGYDLIPVQIEHSTRRWGERVGEPLPDTMVGQPPMSNIINTPDSLFFPQKNGAEMAKRLMAAPSLSSRISVGLAPDQETIRQRAIAEVMKDPNADEDWFKWRLDERIAEEEKKQVKQFSQEIADVAKDAGATTAYAAGAVGVFGGEESEASSAFEAIVPPEKEMDVANAVLVKTFNDAKAHNQRSAFVSRVLPKEERNEPYARPGLTLFFYPKGASRTARTIEEVKDVIKSLPGTDLLGGFTAVASDAPSGSAKGEFQAIRFIWIPEYAGVEIEGLAKNWGDVVETLDTIAQYAEENNIGSAKIEHYDLAIGYEDNYDNQINAAEQLRAGRDAASAGGEGPWKRPVGTSVASRTGVTSEQLQGYRDRGDLQSAGRKFSIPAQLTGSSLVEFKRWFDGSVAVNPDGTPKVFYHGTTRKIKGGQFSKAGSAAMAGKEGPFFFSEDSRFANDYATTDLSRRGTGKASTTGAMYPVFLSVKSPYDFDNKEHLQALLQEIRDMRPDGLSMADMFSPATAEVMRKDEQTRKSEERGFLTGLERGRWRFMERPIVQQAIRNLGFDGFYVTEGGRKNLAVYKPEQIKSIYNQFAPGTAESKKFSISPTDEPAIASARETAMKMAETAKRNKNNPQALDTASVAANKAVQTAVRKLSVLPVDAPMPASIDAVNTNLFAADTQPRTIGETIMGMFGGLGSAAGRTNILDRLRVEYVQKEAQFAKREREAYLNNQLPAFEQNFAEYSAVAAMDMKNRASHYTVEVMRNGAPVVKMINNDPNSMYFEVDSDPDNNPAKVFEIILTSGPNGTSLVKHFRSYAIAQVAKKRLAEGKTLPQGITQQYINECDQLGATYPQIADAFTRYQNFNAKLIKAALDAGVIDKAGYDKFLNGMNYYSMYAQFEEEPAVPGTSSSIGSKIKVREYKGGGPGNLMADPISAMMYNVAFWNNAILQNIASQKALRVGESTQLMKRLRVFKNPNGTVSVEQPDTAAGYVDKVFYTKINGIDTPFATKDPLLAVGLMSNPQANLDGVFKYLGMPTGFLREMVTRDPGFMIANLMRDSVATWVLAGSGARPQDTFKSFVTAYRKNGSYDKLRNLAIIGSFDEAQKSPEKFVAGLRSEILKTNGLSDITGTLKKGWDYLEKLSEASDAATRIAVYDAAKKSGATDFTAAYRALSIMNFSRSGNSAGLKVLTKLIPFLNARIQGFDVLYTGLKSAAGVATGAAQLDFERQRGTAVLYRSMGLMAGALALAALNNDDDDYKQLPQYMKDANILVPVGGGKYISIPKPFEAGLLFMTIPTAVYEMAAGTRSGRSTAKLFYDQFSSTFGFNPVPQFALPILENITNRDFYTGLPLVSPGQEKLDASLQYNASTSYVARGIGQLLKYTPMGYNADTGRFEGVSPILLDNLISGYGGPIASYLGMAVGGITTAFGTDGQGLPVAGSNLPIIRRFFVDAQDKQPQAAADAYELYQQVDKVTRTVSRLKKMGDVEALKEYRAENIDILRVGKQVRKMADNLNNIRAQLRRLEANTTMSGQEKLAKMRELRSREITLTRKIGEINQKLGR